MIDNKNIKFVQRITYQKTREKTGQLLSCIKSNKPIISLFQLSYKLPLGQNSK